MKLCKYLYAGEEEFIQVIDGFNTKVRDQKIHERSWSAKDILSHIVGWEVEFVKYFDAFHLNSDVNDEYDIDKFNKNSVDSRKHIDREEIVDKLKSVQQG